MNAPKKKQPKNQIGLFVLAVIAAAILIQPAYNKLTGAPRSVELFKMLEMEPAGRIAIGLIELACILLLIIPGSSIYGALLSLCVMIGAIIGHATHIGFGGSGIFKALAVATCSVLIIYFRRQQTRLIRSMFRS